MKTRRDTFPEGKLFLAAIPKPTGIVCVSKADFKAGFQLVCVCMCVLPKTYFQAGDEAQLVELLA